MDIAEPVAEERDVLLGLFTAHYRELLRIAAFLLKDATAAEDVVQEAYIRVAGRRLRDPAAALPYLRQTVVNLARSVVRRRIVAARHAPALARGDRLDDPVYAAIERDALVRALRTLPARQREAVVLRHYAGLSEAETAEAMGCAVGSVKAYTSRGLAALAVHLEESR